MYLSILFRSWISTMLQLNQLNNCCLLLEAPHPTYSTCSLPREAPSPSKFHLVLTWWEFWGKSKISTHLASSLYNCLKLDMSLIRSLLLSVWTFLPKIPVLGSGNHLSPCLWGLRIRTAVLFLLLGYCTIPCGFLTLCLHLSKCSFY